MSSFLIRALLLATLAGPVLAGGPFNDSWERALAVNGSAGGFFSTIGATPDGTSSCDVGVADDVWFVYTPATSGTSTLLARPDATTPTFDLVVSVHTLDISGAPEATACDDQGGGSSGFQARVDWVAVAGTPYYLRVAGKAGNSGGFQILLLGAQGLPPANAYRETALPIWPGDYHGYTRNVTGPPSWCLSFSEDAWFTYVPKASGVATVSTFTGSQYDTSLEIEENGVPFRCEDFSDGGEFATFAVQAGSSYLIRIGGAAGFGGVYGLLLAGPDCVGQTCLDPEPIGEGSHLFSLVGALPSGSSSCSPADPDRYFSYVAPADGTLNVSTCETTTAAVQGYAVDARLSLHSACPADGTTELDCSRTSIACAEGFRPQPYVSTPVSQGQHILIRVSTRPDGQLGPLRLEVALAQSLSVCFGDGTGASCPCGNTGVANRGCDNSLGTGGARLYPTGSASVSADTLSLVATDAPRGAPLLLLQGDAVRNGGAGAPFADGLLCVDGNTWRLVGSMSIEGTSLFGALGTQPLSTLGGMPAAGTTRWYQGYYRNPGPFCTSSPANLTNAVRVTWTP